MTISNPQELLEFLFYSYSRSDITEAMEYIKTAPVEDLNYQDKDGQTALMMAARNGEGDIVALLIKGGVDLNYQDQHGQTALMMAVGYGDPDIVALLIKGGVDLNYQDKDGNTALMMAAHNRNADIVALLIKGGVDISLKNNRNQNALDIAQSKNSRSESSERLMRAFIQIDQPFYQYNILNDITGHDGSCYGFTIEITRWIMKHIAKGESEETIDVMKKLNSMLSKNSDNFTKRLAVYHSSRRLNDDSQYPVLLRQNNFFESLPTEIKNKKYIGLYFSCFDPDPQAKRSLTFHAINIRRIGDGESYEVIDANLGSRKCANINELNNHIESILYYNNNTSAQTSRDIRVYDIEKIIKTRDWVPELISDLDSPSEVERKNRDNKEKKYRFDGDILLALTNGSYRHPDDFIMGLIRNADKSSINFSDKLGQTPLSITLSRGYMDMAKLLMEKGADSDKILRDAVSDGDREVIKFLIENGANPDIKNSEGTSLLTATIRDNDSELAELIISKSKNMDNDDVSSLRMSIDANQPKIAKILIEKGAVLDVQNEYVSKAFRRSVVLANKEMVELLLEQGVDVNLQNEYGETALIHFAGLGNKEMVELLLERGADANLKNENGETALMEAITQCKYEALPLLLKKGADVNIRDNLGKTALIRAVRIGTPETISLLLENGADVNIKDNRGKTALDYARLHNNTDVISLLEAAQVRSRISGPIENISMDNLPKAPSPSVNVAPNIPGKNDLKR